MIRYALVALGLLLCLDAVPALAQPAPSPQPATPAAAPPAPAIRRWLDVQSVHAASRFRWFKNGAEQLVSSSVQWQTQLRGRFVFDEAGRYSIGTLASTGAVFPSSWNNTGGGLGTFARQFNVKQLFLSAEPVKGLELQVGGLYMNRGEMAEHLTYDLDAYIVGERVTVRPSNGPVTQVSVTAGHFGDLREVNVFKRFDGMSDFNYGQALVAFSLGPRAAASVDYTHEDGRDIIREGLNIRMPGTVKLLTALKFEAYQRVSDDDGSGFHAAADLRWKRLTLTGGVMSVDRSYPVGLIPFNGDRYEIGKRWYSIGGITLNQDWSVGWFQTEAFDVDFPIPIKHRLDLFITFNPTASLKRAGIF